VPVIPMLGQCLLNGVHHGIRSVAVAPSARLVLYVQVFGRYIFAPSSSRSQVGAFDPVIGWRSFLGVRPGISSVSFIPGLVGASSPVFIIV